jgi:hypothetical protein
MPFIILGRQRFALPIGETRIGGSGIGALPFPELARQPTIAILLLTRDGAVSLWPSRHGAARVIVDGALVGADAVTLVHGATIEAAGLRLLFGDLHELRTTTQLTTVRDKEPALAADELPAERTAGSGGRLAAHGTGVIAMIPESGLVIGRAPDSDLVILGREVSRRHAIIRPSPSGYVLRDVSTNGTYVNGRRVNGSRVLGMGDMIRIGKEELRFEADQAAGGASAGPIRTREVRASISSLLPLTEEPPTGPRRAA